jgi:hypothetical protein
MCTNQLLKLSLFIFSDKNLFVIFGKSLIIEAGRSCSSVLGIFTFDTANARVLNEGSVSWPVGTFLHM